MAKYTLHYFNVRGRAEVSRWILKQAGVHFVDHRLDHADWPAFKDNNADKLPFGQLPIVELEDGTVIGQSLAIARYLAKKHGLAGESEVESALIDSMAHGFDDFVTELLPWITAKFMEKNLDKAEEVKKKLLAEAVPKHITRFEGFLKKNKSVWLVGNKMSWADLLICEFLHRLEEVFDGDILKDCPQLKGHQERVLALPNIKKWMEERPVTPM